LRLTVANKLLRLADARPLAKESAARETLAIAPRRTRSRVGARALMFAALLLLVGARTAFAALTYEPATFNVIGLDSNDVTSGPNIFPVGVRVCNVGGAAVTNVAGTLVWDSSNFNINTTGLNPVTFSSLAAGQCTTVFFNVAITRTTAAYNTSRSYHVNITADGEAGYTTPTPREVYVEKLVSQNRNSTQSISGPSTVVVGQTYNYLVNAHTATGGYEQLESFLSFPNTMFQILSINTTYTSPSGGTNNKVYADACGWDNNPLSATYRSCIGPTNYAGGKAGGTLVTTYTVRILAGGSATLNSTIYDFSGSSYHYGNDFGSSAFNITAQTPPNISLVKSVSPSGTQPPGTDLTYTVNFSNSGNLAAQQFILVDPDTSTTLKINDNTDFKVGSVTTTLGGLSGVTVAYSNDGGVTFAYTPASGGGGAPAGYDRNVTHVRWTFTGSLASSGSGSVSFTARIR
jgi:uncharacterized repeat protein (TIGR01451 family)